MTPERYERMWEIHELALQQETAKRQAYLDAHCAGDPEMRAEVARLLDCVLTTQERDLLVEPCPVNLKKQLPPAMPERLGRYRVLSVLGKGGFAAVYAGWDDELQRQVAIKVPLPTRFQSAADADAYLAEARLLAQLKHPGIVPIYDLGRTAEGLCYLVTPLASGGSLAQRVAQARLPIPLAVEVVRQVADALHHAHKHGLVHRDVKPANILLDADNRPLVADFGLALREQDFGTGPTFAGTVAYMSPEQARGEGHQVDPRTDIYSLGVVLYELLTGRRPFQSSDQAELVMQITKLEPRPPRQRDDTIPQELDRVCLKALQKQVADRYSTAADLAQDLQRWQTGQAGGVSMVPAVRPGAGPFSERRGAGHHVFLCHKTADKAVVEELAHRLARAGIEPWLDKWNLLPEQTWQDAIEEALDACAVCALC